jgi:hypothetical protein
MINLNEIQKSKVIKEPWEHLEIENFLDQKIFNDIAKESNLLVPVIENTPRNNNGFWPFELLNMGYSKNIVDIIMEINKEVLKNHQLFVSKFTDPDTSNIGYYSIPRVGYTPRFKRGEIHDDGDEQDNKTIIIIVYMEPSVCEGTCLYTEKNFDSLKKQVKWQQNKALIFTPKKGITWHDFKTNEEGRFVLNFYCEKIEDSYLIHRFSDDKIAWFYNNLDEITLNLP